MDQDRVIDVFSRMGFDIHRSPDITTAFDNFDALNLPDWHPARDMQDTFWLEDGRVLATQTSCMQNTLLKHSDLPIRSVVLGSVYRNEKIDSTHDVMFDQVEGIMRRAGKKFVGGHWNIQYPGKVDFKVCEAYALKYPINPVWDDVALTHVNIVWQKNCFKCCQHMAAES